MNRFLRLFSMGGALMLLGAAGPASAQGSDYAPPRTCMSSSIKKISLYRDSRIGFDGTLFESVEELDRVLLRERSKAPGLCVSLVAENPGDFEGIGKLIYRAMRLGFNSDTFSVDLQGAVDAVPDGTRADRFACCSLSPK